MNRHFNLDGVIQFENYDDLIAKLQSLTPEFYRDREPAIEENFRRALQGVHQWDLIEGYIAEGIRRKYGNPPVIVSLSKYPDLFAGMDENLKHFAPQYDRVLVRDGNIIERTPGGNW